jgi:hypothetical protein
MRPIFFYHKQNYEDILKRFLIGTHKNLNPENKELNFMGILRVFLEAVFKPTPSLLTLSNKYISLYKYTFHYTITIHYIAKDHYDMLLIFFKKSQILSL